MKDSITRTSLILAFGLLAAGSQSWGAPASHQAEAGKLEDAEDIKEGVYLDGVDAMRHAAGSRVASAARWVDRFFETPDYLEEEADARISVRQKVEFSEEEDVEFRTRISGSISLPHFSRRLKLVFEGNDELETDEEDEPDLRASADESLDAPSVALQYVPLARQDYDFRVSAGIRVSDASGYVGPRWRFQTNLGPMWRTRVTQSVRWYSDEGWRSVTGINVDRQTGTRNLLRQSLSTDWREGRFDSEGFRNTAATSFIQPLSDTKALRYTWSSDYLTRPEERWSASTVSISYRSALFRDWILLELKPFVAWEEKFGWDPNPGVAISLSIIIEEEKLTPQPHIE